MTVEPDTGNYRVIGAPEEVARPHPDTDQIVNGYHVRARHNDTGAIAKVFVPETDYSPENVDAQLRHQFRAHHGVMSLGSQETAQ